MEVQEDLGRKWPNIPHVHQPGRGQAEGEEGGDKAPDPARVARGGAPAAAGQPGGGGGVEAAPAAARQLALQAGQQVELQTNVREDFTITEKAPTRAFSWLKAPTSAFTFKTLVRHYAKRAFTPR